MLSLTLMWDTLMSTYQLVIDSFKKRAVVSVLQVVFASLIIGLAAQIRIPLFFTPVPITCQTFAVMLAGALLGSKKGAFSVLLYLVEGCVGLPVFSNASFGIACLFGPTGGYLVGFVVQAYLIGKFLERRELGAFKTLAILLFSCIIQMGIGVLWLAHFVGLQNVMVMGFYPFIPGEAFKAFAVMSFLKCKSRIKRA